jgi:signal transduction histidine kinase
VSRLQSAAGRVPKDWSFDQWPLRRKLAAALVFPMLLAVVLGGLRVKSEFDQAAAFSSAADRTKVLRPLIEFNAAAQTLASSSVPGGPARNPATTAFDNLAQQLERELKTGDLGPIATREITGALSNGRALRNAVGQSTAFSIVIGKSADTARTTSSAVADLGLTGDDTTAKTITAIQDAIAAQQAMTSQQLNLANKDDAGASIFAIGQVGAETSFLTRLKDESGDGSRSFVQRLTYDNYRRSVTLQAGQLDDSARSFLNDGYRSSNEAYNGVVKSELSQLESTLTSRASEHRTQALINSVLVLLALIAALGLVFALAKSLLDPIRRVREGALEVANKRLPAAVAKLRDGEEAPEFEPIPVTTREEMGQLARAVDDLHKQALTLAGDQARLRVQVGHMFETLSRRSTSLIDQQLTLIENLESDEEDPKRLQSLFRLDHLAARMRRNSDSLLVLAGTSTRRGVTGAISVSDAVRAAVSEVENYQRIDIGEISRDQVLGAVGSDLIHLVAEVVDNALSYSPPTTRVDIRGARTPEGGLLIEVTDRGLGMPPKELAALNDRLANGGDVTADTARRMGLFVVGSLAKRHGIAVRLRRNSREQNGITVSLHLPAGLLADSTAVRTERTGAARGKTAAATGPVAPLTPAAPTSSVGGTTKGGLPTRVRGASGATPSPVPGAAKKLPTRNPGAHGPGAPAEPAAPAKPVVETAHGEAPTRETKPATNGHDAKTHNGHDATPQPEATPQSETNSKAAVDAEAPADTKPPTDPEVPAQVNATDGDKVSSAAAASANGKDTEPGSDKVPEALRSAAGLPVRQRNASRITEYREFEAAPEPTTSEPSTEGPSVSKEAPSAPKHSRLTGWLPGRKAAAEAARVEAEAAETRQMPSNLSAWLDHRAKLAEAAKTGEAADTGQVSDVAPSGDDAPSAEAADADEAPSSEAADSPIESVEASALEVEASALEVEASTPEVVTEPAPVEAFDTAVVAEPEPSKPEPIKPEPSSPEPELNGAEPNEAEVDSVKPEPAAPETIDTGALPTRVPGMSGAVAPEATDGQAPRPTRRPLATSFFGARKAVEVEPDQQAPAPVAQADVNEAHVAEAHDEAPGVEQPIADAPIDAQAFLEPVPEPLPPAPALAQNDINDTPIFRAMMSNWLTDDTSGTSGSWSTSEADAAWSAAARIEEQEPTEESSAGLPKRRPGSYLIPGAMDVPEAAPAAVTTGSRRDPETIRRNLNRHHQGVSSARTEAQDGTQREEADVHH